MHVAVRSGDACQRLTWQGARREPFPCSHGAPRLLGKVLVENLSDLLGRVRCIDVACMWNMDRQREGRGREIGKSV